MVDSVLLIEGVGILAGVLGLIAWMPQTFQIWVNKKNDGVSLATLSLIVVALVLWTIYGFLKSSISLIMANGIALLIISFVALGVVKIKLANGDKLIVLPNLLITIFDKEQ